jgi:hypothetical protein
VHSISGVYLFCHGIFSSGGITQYEIQKKTSGCIKIEIQDYRITTTVNIPVRGLFPEKQRPQTFDNLPITS